MRTPDEIARILEEDMMNAPDMLNTDASGEELEVPESWLAKVKPLGLTAREIGIVSDGSTASYYELPLGCSELQELISWRNMNAQIGEIFRACYRYGQASHSDMLRDAKKMKFYAEAEIARLEKYGD